MAENNKSKRLWDQYGKYLARRRKWEAVWDELARYEFPHRQFTLGLKSEGERDTDDLFDSTAVFANEVLAASLQSGLTNQAIKWFKLKLSDEDLMHDDEVKFWLEDTNNKMLAAFAASNFGTESSELYMDLGVFGIGAMFVGENPQQVPVMAGNSFRGLRFEAMPTGAFVIDENGWGKVNTFVYRIMLTPQAAAGKFGLKSLSEHAQKLFEKGSVDDLVFVHFVLPQGNVAGINTKLPIASVWMEEKTKHIVFEGGFRSFPFAVPRWHKASGEPYGHGPGLTALPDVKTLNKEIELNLKALAVATQPPMKSRINSVIGAVDLSPGGLTVVRNMEDLEELVTRANFSAAEVKIADLRQSIRRVFFVDQLLQLLARETPAMTATEVTAKMQLLREIVGPAFVRLEDEFLNPVIDRVFDIMFRAGVFLSTPEVLSERRIEVDYESPIGLAKRGQELIAIDRVTLKAQELAGVGKVEVLDNLDADEIIRITAEIAGAPRSILKTTEERDAIRKAREEAQATQQIVETMARGSEVAKNIAPLAKVTQEAVPPTRT